MGLHRGTQELSLPGLCDSGQRPPIPHRRAKGCVDATYGSFNGILPLMTNKLETLLLDPYPHRSIYLALVKRLRLFGYLHRVEIGAVDRPHYGYCLYQGCRLAKRLGIEHVSAIEFGVAGGNGLVNLEHHAREISRSLGVKIDVFGFDTGSGLPAPVDYRDLPYHWKAGFYQMDETALRKRLHSAELVLGNILDTTRTFLTTRDPPPIAAVMVDVDLYSSTTMALKLFSNIDDRYILPRVFFYFDDINGAEAQLYSDHSGERLAIDEFNASHEQQKFSPAHYLLARKVVLPWYHSLRVLHNFKHKRYNEFVSSGDQQLQLA
jgi:hypothetical protein